MKWLILYVILVLIYMSIFKVAAEEDRFYEEEFKKFKDQEEDLID